MYQGFSFRNICNVKINNLFVIFALKFLIGMANPLYICRFGFEVMQALALKLDHFILHSPKPSIILCLHTTLHVWRNLKRYFDVLLFQFTHSILKLEPIRLKIAHCALSVLQFLHDLPTYSPGGHDNPSSRQPQKLLTLFEFHAQGV